MSGLRCPSCQNVVEDKDVRNLEGEPHVSAGSAYRYKIKCSSCKLEGNVNLKPSWLGQLRDALDCGHKITAIKCIRALTDCRLQEAKDVIDIIFESKD